MIVTPFITESNTKRHIPFEHNFKSYNFHDFENYPMTDPTKTKAN